MLSGLVFYANVGVNCTVFLPVEPTNAFSIFIAWLNLDFGIEYNGMDAYSKTWLQFVFPVYIWSLVGLMIAVSHLSCRFAKLLGNNPVSVLATLILLSYTPTLFTALYITYLEYSGFNRIVWLYDANIDYFGEKHILVFVVAVLVFLFLFLLYTFFASLWSVAVGHIIPEALLMGQQCQAKTIFGYTMLPTKQNIATGLDYCLCFAFFFF